MFRFVINLWVMAPMVLSCARVAAAQTASSTAPPDAAVSSQSAARTASAWSGFHVGGHTGMLGGSSIWSTRQPAGANLSGSVDLFRRYDFVDGSGSYFGGLGAGYDHRLSARLVIGAEGDVSFGAEPASGTDRSGGADRFNETPEVSGTVRGRLGYSRNGWVAYGTGGLAWTRVQLSFVATTGAGGSAPSRDQVFAGRTGWTIGAGIEKAIASGWSARAEYLHSSLGGTDAGLPSGARVTSSLSTHQVRIGLTYAFAGADSLTLGGAPLGIAPLEVDGWSAHAQTTYVSQYAPPFRAPYHGANSLDTNSGRETWDVTFYLGRRLWSGAALWINPEIDQGYGLSGTLGVAGFTSGEAYKVGHTNAYLRVPRAFVQQTLDLGGEAESREAGLNQFQESHRADRVVITAGKFSVSDLFDTISYAHDPRNDFMNWSLVDAGTFDYAADAWGFTYGAAIEWYERPWTTRAGVFDLSSVPNSADLDPHFHQFQLVYELEHQHTLSGRPGRASLVGFVSRARMGSYRDALAHAAQNGTVPDTGEVRRYDSRPGVNVNIGQQVGSDVGVFGRLGWASGRVESYEFTDIDRTIAAGVSLNGARWGRREDTVGVATVLNGISDAHTAYLAAGGLGILVGDGQLPHPGLESIVESYYRLAIGPWQVTGDYQLISNPAFNRDRGPVSVLSVRLRAQF